MSLRDGCVWNTTRRSGRLPSMSIQDNLWPPKRSQLWQGSLLATIAHSLYVVADPELSYELSWDGPNYSRQDSQGTRGTVTFAPDRLVAVFRDDHSSRMPERADAPYNLDPYFTDMPEDLRALAHAEALQYVFDEYNSKIAPLITAAFWSRGDTLTAAEPWSQVLKHGAHLLDTELSEPEGAVSAWAEYYGLSDEQVDLLRALFRRKTTIPDEQITLDQPEYRILVSKGSEGLEECRELLLALGIVIPE